MIRLGDGAYALPYSYAWDVLNCEIQMDLATFVSQELIDKACRLYQLGADFFLQTHSRKFEYFQKKLKSVQERKETEREVTIKMATPENKKLQLEKKLTDSINEFTKPTDVKVWLDANGSRIDKIKHRVEQSLEVQDEQLNQRLKARRLKRANTNNGGLSQAIVKSQVFTMSSFREEVGRVPSDRYLYQVEEAL